MQDNHGIPQMPLRHEIQLLCRSYPHGGQLVLMLHLLSLLVGLYKVHPLKGISEILNQRMIGTWKNRLEMTNPMGVEDFIECYGTFISLTIFILALVYLCVVTIKEIYFDHL